MDQTTFGKHLNTRWLGQTRREFESISSTSEVAQTLRREGRAVSGLAVVSRHQTAGRGRMGRQWISPAHAGLYTSFVVYPPKLSGILSLLAGVALSEAVERLVEGTPGLKWPNDGIINGKKYGGILVEAGQDPEPWAIIGVGVNVLGTPSATLPYATTLAEACHYEGSVERLWGELCSRLEFWYDTWIQSGADGIVARWQSYSVTLGQEIAAIKNGEQILGVAESVDEEGALWIRDAGEKRIRVVSGEVSIRLPNGDYASFASS